jgi:hypothetical protein
MEGIEIIGLIVGSFLAIPNAIYYSLTIKNKIFKEKDPLPGKAKKENYWTVSKTF